MTNPGWFSSRDRRVDGHDLKTVLPPDFVYWREFAPQFFHQLCSVGEDELQKLSSTKAGRAIAVEPPPEMTLVRLIEDAPPMRGLDCLTPDVLRKLWDDLRQFALRQAVTHVDGPVAWLRRVNALWNLPGRVTFHRAENKRDAERPVAFLATYTHRLSAKAKLQHLPLAEALKRYVGEKDEQKLTTLLEPVRKAVAKSPMVREMPPSNNATTRVKTLYRSRGCWPKTRPPSGIQAPNWR